MPSFNIDSEDTEVLNEFKDVAKGKSFLITGASQSGIGAQVAVALASASPELIILAGRNKRKSDSVILEIQDIDPTIKVEFVELNLLSNASIHESVAKIKAITKRINVLINNAGVMGTRTFILSEDGVESQFASNYLGHFLLTNLLLKEGLVCSGDVVLNVCSLGYQMDDIHFDDINYKNGELYNGWKAYGQSKSAQILGTRALSNRLKERGVVVLGAHPGVTLETRLLANSSIDEEYFGEAYAIAIERNNGNPLPPQIMVSIKQAAGVILYTALNPNLRDQTGALIVENKIYDKIRDYANNDSDADKLWQLSEKLVGEAFVF